jgi:hypothetical protein
MSRWARFLIVLLVGFAVGLLYGWVIDPVEYVDTVPDSLRSDFQADYVLMVAEAYQADRDLDLALQRLAFFGSSSPADSVEQAMFFAVQSGYSSVDLGILRTLSDALQVVDPSQGEAAP